MWNELKLLIFPDNEIQSRTCAEYIFPDVEDSHHPVGGKFSKVITTIPPQIWEQREVKELYLFTSLV